LKIRKRLVCLTATMAIASMGMASGLTAYASADSLTGAGSTLVAPLMAHWAADFQSKTGNTVTYGSVGSSSGISQISSRTVNFGASDAPLTPQQAGACDTCVQIPWALSAVAVAFNVPGVTHLQLTGKVVALIYQGAITNWNDARIKKLNKGVNLPNLQITPAFRSDGSGTTYAFTDFLSRVSKSFRSHIGFSTAVSFPVGTGGKGNDGVTAVVNSTSGAIGYIGADYAVAHGISVAAMQNRAGKFLFPNLKNIEDAALLVKKVPKSNELHIVNPPPGNKKTKKLAKKAYPISTFTYVIVPKVSPKKDLLAQFILYAMTQGQVFGPALDFPPIPKIVLDKAKKDVQKFKTS
jgi:phosphate transport system substrate-binding protein